MKKSTTLTGTIKALAQTVTGKPRRLMIQAYSGGVVYPQGLGPCVFALESMAIPATVPVLASHQNDLDAVIGTGIPKIETINGQLGLTVTVQTVAPGEASDRVFELLDAGVSLQSSVGLQGEVVETLSPGQTVEINGRTIEANPEGAGVMICRGFALREVSVCAVAGDSETYTVAAKAGTMNPHNALSRESILAEERARVSEINAYADTRNLSPASANEVQALYAKAINGEITVAHFKNGVLNAQKNDLRATHSPTGDRTRSGYGVASEADVLAAALMTRSGYGQAAEKSFGPGAMEASRALHSASLPDLCMASLKREGRTIPHDRGSMIRASLSSGSLPVALGTAATKILETTYNLAPATWRSWCSVRSAKDFKTQYSVRPSFLGDLEELPEDGAIKHATFAENTISWSIGQFAKILTLGRKEIINDDLGVFSEAVPAMARAAQRSLSSKIYSVLLANTGSHFSSGNNNYISSGDMALSISSLATAVKKLRQQKDRDGNTLDLSPAVLLVPPELEVVARALLNSETLTRDASEDSQPNGNSMQNLCKLEVEGRLSNATFTGYSTTAWYLFASPADLPLLVGFLNGNEVPQIETFGFDAVPDSLQMSLRCVFDYGAALGDFRAAVKSTGA